jgi:hypothetical protein
MTRTTTLLAALLATSTLAATPALAMDRGCGFKMNQAMASYAPEKPASDAAHSTVATIDVAPEAVETKTAEATSAEPARAN